MITILPPAPFPPRSLDEGDGVDLAVRLWNDAFQRAWIAGAARELLEQRLALAVDGGEWERAALLQAALVDTWPVAAALEDAGRRWRAQLEPAALAITCRAAELVRLARGWAPMLDGHGCLPDPAWLRAQAPDDGCVVRTRCPGDGSSSVAQALGLPSPGAPPQLAGVEVLTAEQAVAQRARLAGSLARGELRAVVVHRSVPSTPQVQLALGEFRLEGSHQGLLERYGLAGLDLDVAAAGSGCAWEDEGVLSPHRAGEPGLVLRPCCEGRFLPGPTSAIRAGRPQRVGYMLWDAPVRPVAVAPVAVVVLNALDGQRDTPALAELLGGPIDQVQEVLDELVLLGAATAAG